MNISTALNRKYIKYTIVMLTSLCLSNRQEKIDAYLLHSELEEPDMEYLKREMREYDIQIHFLKLDPKLFDDRLPRTKKWSIEAYYRLRLLDILPKEVDRILYIDVDIIINKSLQEVYELDFGEDELIVCADFFGQKSWNIYTQKQQQMFHTMRENGYVYFNSGFLLMNIVSLRKKYSFATYLHAIEEWNYEMCAPDQDILNYVHGYHVGYIDHHEYNLFAKLAYDAGYDYQKTKDEVTVIHYSGTKPWETKGVHYNIEKIWWDYAKKTSFYQELLEDFLEKTLWDTTLDDEMKHLTVDVTRKQEKLMEMIRNLQKGNANES